MPWNSTSPNGALSVKANRTPMNQNTTYIETTMGNSVIGTNTTSTRDHFWNVGTNEDGRHRFIQSPAFTVGGNATDPVIGTGMDGVQYLKTTNGRVEGFYRNANGIYQHIPSFLSGTHVITASFTTMVTVPASVWGEIFIFQTTTGSTRGQAGFFKSNATVCDAWSYAEQAQSVSSSTPKFNVIFGNGPNASGLNIRVIVEEAVAGATWNYRITYRAI